MAEALLWQTTAKDDADRALAAAAARHTVRLGALPLVARVNPADAERFRGPCAERGLRLVEDARVLVGHLCLTTEGE